MQRQNAKMIHIQHRQPAHACRQHDGETQRGDERSRLSRLAQASNAATLEASVVAADGMAVSKDVVSGVCVNDGVSDGSEASASL